jgi:hypothetical protein
MNLVDMGLLDVEEPGLKIKVRVCFAGCAYHFSHRRVGSLTLFSW